MNHRYKLDQIQQEIAANPEKWRPLVFTNGCFDILHAGHIRYLKSAASLGKSLVVGLNSDVSVAKIKPAKVGLPPRPINPEQERAEILEALRVVDRVIIFEETTASKIIEKLKPEIYVKGGDYNINSLPEAPVVQAYGGEIKLVKISIGTSTTGIIERILKC